MAQLELITQAGIVEGQGRHAIRQPVVIIEPWPILQLATLEPYSCYRRGGGNQMAAQAQGGIDCLLVMEAVHGGQLLFQPLQLPLQPAQCRAKLLMTGRSAAPQQQGDKQKRDAGRVHGLSFGRPDLGALGRIVAD